MQHTLNTDTLHKSKKILPKWPLLHIASLVYFASDDIRQIEGIPFVVVLLLVVVCKKATNQNDERAKPLRYDYFSPLSFCLKTTTLLFAYKLALPF